MTAAMNAEMQQLIIELCCLLLALSQLLDEPIPLLPTW